MGKDTGISWASDSHNRWWGCIKVGPECERCYAESWSRRCGFHENPTDSSKFPIWGPSTNRRILSEKNRQDLFRFQRRARKEGRKRITFHGSMCDTFEKHPQLIEPRITLFEDIDQCPDLIHLLLTKRPHEMRSMVPPHWMEQWPENVVPMVTIGVQKSDWRWDELMRLRRLKHPPKHFGISCEPMLGPIDLFEIIHDGDPRPWLIIGGESDDSAEKARPFEILCALDLVEQARELRMPTFVKQLGCRPTLDGQPFAISDHAGKVVREWPVGLQVQEVPDFERSISR